MAVNWELGVSNPMQGINQGLASLGQALQYRQQMDRQAAQDESAGQLRSLQTQTAQINLDDALAQQKAKVLAGGGDINAFYEQQQKVEKLKEVGDFLSRASKTPGGIKGSWPILTQAFPELAKANPDDFKTDNGYISKDEYSPEGVFMGRAIYDPEKRTIHVMQPPKPDQGELLDKRLAATATENEKNRQAADTRLEKTLAGRMAKEERKSELGKRGKPLPAGQLESIADMKRVKDVLAEADTIFATGKVSTGPVAGRAQSIGSKVDIASDDSVNMQQKLQTAQNIMLKLRSGAAVTESEYARFLKEYPTPNDPPETFKRKMANTIAYASTLMDEKMDIYEEGGYKVPRETAGSKPSGNQPQKAPRALPKGAKTVTGPNGQKGYFLNGDVYTMDGKGVK